MYGRTRPCLAALALLSAAGLAFAHDDDPKLRTQVVPRQSKGYRNAFIANPGQYTANPGQAGGTLEMGSGGFPADGISLLAWMPLSEFGNPQSGNDCWGYTSPSGREYAIFGHWDGTSFVEITDPTNPVLVRTIPTQSSGSGNLWRDMKTYGEYCYVVTENTGGIQVIDMGQIDAGQVNLVKTVYGTGTDDSHNVAIDEVSGFLYRCGGGNEGLRIYDLSNPTNPTYVGEWDTKYVHDAQIVTYQTGPYAGKQIAFCFDGFDGGWVQPGVDILDVTDKGNIQVLDSFEYPSAAYSHQGWLSPDYQHLYVGDELDEQSFGFGTRTHVYDVSDLSNAVNMGWFTNGTDAVGHNMYSAGNLLYEADYRSGLRVFDISNPANPTHVAYFDTYPANDNGEFNGLWSCYPYFPSGVVIGSDRDSGLFVLWPGDAELAFDFPQGPPDVVDPAGEDVPVTISETSPGVYVSGTAMLHVDDGQGWVSIPMNDLGGGQFEASFPATACGTSLSYYVTAEGTSGITWSDPVDAPLSLYSASSGLGFINFAADDMEVDTGWVVGAGGDDATTGIWERVNPNGTIAQPEDDHTDSPGVTCWVTGQGPPGGGTGENDVDSGRTTLLSPVYDLSASSEPLVSYWRWFSNNTGPSPSTDVLQVDISDNGGSTWVGVEVVGPTGPEAEGGWFQHSFQVTQYVQPTANVRLRFIASDEGSGSYVEAAIDDLTIDEVECEDCGPVNYCQTAPNSIGSGAVIGSSGTPSVSQNAFVLEATSAAPTQPGIFYYGPNQIELPFGDGYRCVGGGTFRLYPPVSADAFGDVVRPLDLTLPPANSGAGMIQAGDTWNFQFWYRDPAAGGAGFNFSDGLAVTFCP